jgi:hypothetical protein
VGSLTDIATEEVIVLRRLLATEWAPSHPVSVLLYQPLAEKAGDSGRLIDVGPRPKDADESVFCWQPAHAGATGHFLQDAMASLSLIPSRQQYTKTELDSYRSAMPDQDRRRQVKLEKARHMTGGRIKQWPSDDVPEEGLCSWHLALSPWLRNAEASRWPAVGTVYTLNEGNQQDPTLARLVRFAQIAGNLAIANRIDHLFPDGKDAFIQLHDLEGRHCDDWLMHFAFQFIFSHHWLYPFDPLAFRVINKLTDGKARDVYEQHEWIAPPGVHTNETPIDIVESISTLGADLRQLVMCVTDSRPVRDGRAAIESALSNALLALTGVPVAFSQSLRGKIVRTRFSSATSAAKGLLGLLPTVNESTLALSMPLFERRGLFQNVRSLQTDVRAELAPGCSIENSRRGYLMPDAYLTALEGATATVENPELFPRNPWFRNYVRQVLMNKLVASSKTAFT